MLTITALVPIWLLTVARTPTPATAALAACLAGLCMVIARIFDRAKRVWLTAETLRISDLRREIEVGHDQIESVALTPWFRPARLRIKLAQPTVFGDTVYFFPPLGQAGAALRRLPRPICKIKRDVLLYAGC